MKEKEVTVREKGREWRNDEPPAKSVYVRRDGGSLIKEHDA